MKNKRGQMKMSFGMIFTIFLIIAFIAFAIYAITKFLNLQDSIKEKQFQENLQTDLEKMWKSTQGSKEVEYFLPKSSKGVCFVNQDKNFYLELKEGRHSGTLEYIDLEKTLSGETKKCFESVDNIVSFTLEKSFGDSLVTIK